MPSRFLFTSLLFSMFFGMQPGDMSGYEILEREGIRYHILRAEPTQVRIVWADDSGKPLRTFAAVHRFLISKGEKPATLINGGIFEPAGIPSGLLIQYEKELRPLNTSEGKGNFFLKPNGIFLIREKEAAVIAASEFTSQAPGIQFAVQSGPLLLHKGNLHPVFRPESTSRLHRNGVGVTESGTVIFAMSDLDSPKRPNLHEFASLFKSLGCPSALFLDGDISQMLSGEAMKRPGNHFGSIIAVMEKSAQ